MDNKEDNVDVDDASEEELAGLPATRVGQHSLPNQHLLTPYCSSKLNITGSKSLIFNPLQFFTGCVFQKRHWYDKHLWIMNMLIRRLENTTAYQLFFLGRVSQAIATSWQHCNFCWATDPSMTIYLIPNATTRYFTDWRCLTVLCRRGINLKKSRETMEGIRSIITYYSS